MTADKRAKVTDLHREEASRLKALWDARPHPTQAVFGETYDLGNQANVGHYLNGRSALNVKAARAFADALKCRIEEFSPRVAAELQALAGEKTFGQAEGRGVGWSEGTQSSEPRTAPLAIKLNVREAVTVTEETSPFLPGFAGLSIPLLANAASMGVGSEQLHDDVVVGRLSVSPEWVSRSLKPTKIENLRFIHGYGDSMQPTFVDGDVLLVDVGITDPKIDGVYVLEANDRIYIKRVRQRMDGRFEISSDNPTVKTVDVLNGESPVQVHGRVVWCWNGRKL